MPNGKICYLEIPAKDVDASAGFYTKMGFEIVGKEFDIPDVGPHYRMKLML